ncbi:hypothetical protein [Acetobacter sp. DmW_043]|uniref:hypothetical protein n=1 Tax=Acetobacter sp. DmW_043 TaxID=1670658 RepID=UPI001177ED0D|nr:hypothetical protein [Acetobacter sp. DmW_043]
MFEQDDFGVILGLLANFVAISFLNIEYRIISQQVVFRIISFIVLEFLSLYLMIGALGPVLGVLVGVIGFCLSGFSLVIVNVDYRPKKPLLRRSAAKSVRLFSRTHIWRGSVRGLSALVVASLTALLLSAAYASLPLGTRLDRVVNGVLVTPFVWVALGLWVIGDQHIRRPLLSMVVLCMFAGFIIFLRAFV